MTTAMAMPGNTASTFLVHFFGGGLADERYVVERFGAQTRSARRLLCAQLSADSAGNTTTS